MAKKQFLDYEGLTELVKHIPILQAGNNVKIVSAEGEPNKITISSETNIEFANITDIDLLFD